ncbi:MAG: hypothetical protein KDA58_05535 [Planctomycetaceae bacterium]|nr:hypothetical protein [Planctomycetaceae bacterium]
MSPQLPPDIAEALHANPGDCRVIDPSTQRVYVLVDDETHRRAMRALREQEDFAAIQEGIAQMERGETLSLEEARRLTEERLLARKQ